MALPSIFETASACHEEAVVKVSGMSRIDGIKKAGITRHFYSIMIAAAEPLNLELSYCGLSIPFTICERMIRGRII